MRVLYLRAGAPAYESRVMKELTFLVKNKFEVEVLAWDRTQTNRCQVEYLSVAGQKVKVTNLCVKAPWEAGVRRLAVPLLRYSAKQFACLLKDGRNYDVIHASDLETVVPAILYKKIGRIKVVYDIFDYYADNHNLKGLLRRAVVWLDTRMIQMSDQVILCSEERREQIGRVRQRNITVIHNSPPIYNSGERKAGQCQDTKLVYFGSLSSGRYLEELLHTVGAHPDWHLQIGGLGPLADYAIEAAERSGNISYLGRVSYEDVLRYEEGASLLTALYDPRESNHRYAAPNKFYEALMLGIPVVMIRGTGMSNLVQSEGIGYVIDVEKEGIQGGLEQAVRWLEENRENLGQISKKMKKIYAEFYSWEQMELRLRAVYAFI